MSTLGRGMLQPVVEDLSTMIGKTLLAGITYLDAGGVVTEQVQLAGTVIAVDPLVAFEVAGRPEPFTLPPMPQAFDVGSPGEYRLRGSGEIVIDPDYLTSWTVDAADRAH